MTFENAIRQAPWKGSLFRVGLLGLLVLASVQCTKTTDAPMDTGPITFLKPEAGSKFKRSDSVQIIWVTDYTRITDEFNVAVSDDSGATWGLILSLKTGKGKAKAVYDTITWIPDSTFTNPGPIKLRVSAYEKKYFDISGYMTLEAGTLSHP